MAPRSGIFPEAAPASAVDPARRPATCDAIRQLQGAAQPCLRWVQAPRRRSATRAVSVEPLSADSAISAWVRLRRQVSLWLTGSASPVVCVDAGLGVRTVPTQRPLATAGCWGT